MNAYFHIKKFSFQYDNYFQYYPQNTSLFSFLKLTNHISFTIGCYNSTTTLMNHNQSSLQYNQTNDNLSFSCEFPLRLDKYGNKKLEFIVKKTCC